jgi:excisionase family DNA binding protein
MNTKLTPALPPGAPLYLTICQASAATTLSEAELRRAIRARRLSAYKVGRRVLIGADRLRLFVEGGGPGLPTV